MTARLLGCSAGLAVSAQLARRSHNHSNKDSRQRWALPPEERKRRWPTSRFVRNCCPWQPGNVRCEEIRHVVCIGAGAAGLCCAKELLERGFRVTVLESREGLGGVWRYEASSVPGVRKGQHATSSKYYLGFSDFPIPEEADDFPSHETYLNYLKAYAAHFHVAETIRFQHKVTKVQKTDDGWVVNVSSPSGVEALRCDAVAVCAGLHGNAVVPRPPGEFSGQLLHAAEVKDTAVFSRGCTVVVGGGEMGAEMAHLAAESGKGVLSLRRGITCIGQYYPLPLAGRMPDAREVPIDLGYPRIFNLLNEKWRSFAFTNYPGIYELRDDNPGKHTPMRVAAASLSALTGLMTGALVALSAVGGAVRELWLAASSGSFWDFSLVPFQAPDGVKLSAEMVEAHTKVAHRSSSMQRNPRQLEAYTARAADFRMRGFTEANYREVRSLLEEYSGAWHCGNFLTKSDDFIYDLLDGKLQLRPGIRRFQGKDVVFDDGSVVEADAVVFCTGYDPHLPFLSELALPHGPTGALDPVGLYKRVFSPSLPSLAFIGFARPQLGAMPPIAELQARWFAATLVGDSQLPDPARMQAAISEEMATYDAKIFSKRFRAAVNFSDYTSELADLAGCHPKIGIVEFFSDFSLWRAYWFGPCLPQVYRMSDAGDRGTKATAYVQHAYELFFSR